MSFNLANKSKDEMDKLYVDKEAAGVAFKERYNQPVIAEQVAATQPSHLQDYFLSAVCNQATQSPSFADVRFPWYGRTADHPGTSAPALHKNIAVASSPFGLIRHTTGT
jgi:DNA polymerase-3 subunit theta